MLGDHGSQAGAKGLSNHRLFVAWEDSSNPFNGAENVRSVYRGEDQVPRLCRRDGGSDRRSITYLADHDYIGILTYRIHQRLIEISGVESYLSLAD